MQQRNPFEPEREREGLRESHEISSQRLVSVRGDFLDTTYMHTYVNKLRPTVQEMLSGDMHSNKSFGMETDDRGKSA